MAASVILVTGTARVSDGDYSYKAAILLRII